MLESSQNYTCLYCGADLVGDVSGLVCVGFLSRACVLSSQFPTLKIHVHQYLRVEVIFDRVHSRRRTRSCIFVQLTVFELLSFCFNQLLSEAAAAVREGRRVLSYLA